jgi:hypothetical protein
MRTSMRFLAGHFKPTLGFAAALLCALTLSGCDSDNSTAPFLCSAVKPDTVFYSNLGTFDTLSFDEGGVNVTGSGPIDVSQTQGLGIVGGFSAGFIDGTEWISFSFDAGAANEVGYSTTQAGDLNGDGLYGKVFVQAFAPDGRLLGVYPDLSNTDWTDVSAMFGDVPISAFDVIADVDGVTIDRLGYSPCQ